MSGISTVAKIRYNTRGVYNSGVRYVVDDLVYYAGSYYRCVVEGTTGTTPTLYDQNNSPWEKLSTSPYHQGEWASGTTYYAGDVVGVTTTYYMDHIYNWYDEDSYICISPPPTGISGNSNHPYHATSKWKKLSTGRFNKTRAFLDDALWTGQKCGTGKNNSEINYKKLWDARAGALDSNQFKGGDRGYASGGIGIVSLTSGGSGFTTTHGYPAGLSTATVTFSGTGTGARGVAYVNASGNISRVEITDPGQGYESNPTVTISGGGGSSATATCYAYQDKVGVSDYLNKWGGEDSSGNNPATYAYFNRAGSIMSGGYNDPLYGPHGNGNSSSYNEFSEIPFIHNEWWEGLLPTPDGLPPQPIQILFHGQYGATVLFNNGEIHCNGYNGHGQIGDNTTTNALQYVRAGNSRYNKTGSVVLRGKKAIRIAATHTAQGGGSAHSNYALIENPDGTREVWSWGYNGYGQLADGTVTNRDEPTLVATESGLGKGKFIGLWAAGDNYGQVWLLTDQGHLLGAGYNGNGNLGVNDQLNKSTFTSQQDSFAGIPLWKGDNAIRFFSSQSYDSATYYSLVTERGELWTWGYHDSDRSGIGAIVTDANVPIRVSDQGVTSGTATNYDSTNVGSLGTGGRIFGQSTGYYVTKIFPSLGGIAGATHAISVTTDSSYASKDWSGSDVAGLTTCLGTGVGGTYNLPFGAEGTALSVASNQSKYIGIVTSSGYIMRDVVEFKTVAHSDYAQTVLRCHHKNRVIHYQSPYSYGAFGSGDSAAYNIDQYQDERGIASNYQYKPLRLWPTAELAENQQYVWIKPINGNANGYALSMMVDLRSGRMYHSGNTNRGSFSLLEPTTHYGYTIYQKLSYH